MISVVPQMTSTSPSSSAPATSCSPMASTVLDPSTASPTFPMATPLISTRGICDGFTPASASVAASHSVPV